MVFSQLMECKHVLDLGIGLGGEYIHADGQDILRVGFDYDRGTIFYLSKNGFQKDKLSLVLGDANVCQKFGLPFKNGSFDQIDSVFPYKSLLQSITYSDSLWSELNRTMRDEGELRIFLECPTDNLFLRDYGRQRWVEKISRSHGFELYTKIIGRDELTRLGTSTSETLKEFGGFFHFFEISGKKIESL